VAHQVKLKYDGTIFFTDSVGLVMCLAVPARVVEIKGEKAVADFGGIRREVLLSLIGKVKIGDYLIVHTGYAIQVMNRKEAKETLKLWKEILQEQK